MKLVKIALMDEATGLPTGKIEEVELHDSIAHLVDTAALTDSEGVFFQRQLEYIQAQSYDVLYPDLMGREVFTVNTEGGEGINVITYRSYDKRGEAQFIAGKATDLPRADIDGKEYSTNVRTIGNAFGYSRQEIAAAKLTGMPLEARKAEATRRAYEEKVNATIFFGSAANGVSGLFGGVAGAPWSQVTSSLISGATPAARAWYGAGATKTPKQIIADLTASVQAMYVDTKKIFRPDTILMSVEAKQYLMNTPRSETTDTSILSWFLANNMFIKSADQIKDINELAGIYSDTSAGTFVQDGSAGDGFTVMASGSDNARVREPFPYVHLPVQYKGLEFEVNCYGRFGGLEIIRPGAIQHFHGIKAA